MLCIDNLTGTRAVHMWPYLKDKCVKFAQKKYNEEEMFKLPFFGHIF